MRQSEGVHFIGITGGVGAGKSEILHYIKTHYKCRVYLADEVAHLVKRPGTKCFDELKTLLGGDIVAASGEIDRALMAERIFADPELLAQVNDIVHPAVRAFLLERLAEAKADPEVELFFVEAALLIETGYRELVDEMWYIYADEGSRIERLREGRGYGEEKSRRIMERQLTEAVFRENCDFVLDNSGPIEDSYRQIDKKLEAFTWQE
ncbi:MAG: dephospho-CoA kinase [Candidatus Gastranaerophilales bacterium]|nr:dephospho-CoA kinase [Candidatus Gastranaerophilales bacterium]